MKNLFKIAIIDSGIDCSHPRLKNCKISGLSFIKDNGEIRTILDDFEDEIGHGTGVATIIHRMIPKIELVGVKLSSTLNNYLTEDILCQSIEWCISQKDIKIINISMGIVQSTPSLDLHNICKKAFDKNIVVCASAHNKPGKKCYPAYLNSVFGVVSGYVKNKFDYGYIHNSPINIIAKGTTQRVASLRGTYQITSGSSYATAHFTGIVANMLIDDSNNNKDLPSLIENIKKFSNKDVKEIQYIRQNDSDLILNASEKELNGEEIFSINKAMKSISQIALFPSSEKEMSTIVNFMDQCPYKITKLYDYPSKYKIDNNESVLSITEDIFDSDFLDFDTIVIGYFLDQIFDANIKFGYDLIQKSIENNKHFILFDRDVLEYIKSQLTIEKNKSYSGNIYMSYVDRSTYENIIQFNYLPSIGIPVLSVVGTSNKQGKITTQMRLKEILKKADYRISHISTEPQGMLLGADYCFPYGHKGTVKITEDVWGVFLNTVMKGISFFNKPHIIVTGTQGSLIRRSKSDYSLYRKGALSSLHYLCGISPDAIVCAINPQDTIELIQDMTKSIDIFSNAKILFYVMTPWERNFKKNSLGKLAANHRFLDKKEMANKMSFFENELKIPVINIMDYSNDSLILDIIENAFTTNTLVKNSNERII